MRAAIVALFAAFALTPPPAMAGAVFTSKTTTVRLTNDACEGVPAQLLGEEEAKAFRKASVTHNGREIAACWTLQDDRVAVVDAEGDAGYIPAAAFKPDGL
jgi:hypothetical protein